MVQIASKIGNKMRFNAELPLLMNVVVPVTCEIATLEGDDL
jgi:hypothetical protein